MGTTWDTLGWDILHVIYNLVYPAILGGFIYEFSSAQRARLLHRDRSGSLVIAPQYEVRAARMRQLVVVVIYALDFLVARKLYEGCCSTFGTTRLWISIAAEGVTLWTLHRAFMRARRASAFFGWLALLMLVVLVLQCIYPNCPALGRGPLLVLVVAFLVAMSFAILEFAGEGGDCGRIFRALRRCRRRISLVSSQVLSGCRHGGIALVVAAFVLLVYALLIRDNFVFHQRISVSGTLGACSAR